MKLDAVLLDKINRYTAWLSFIIVAVYLATGFGMVGIWGVRELLGKARAEYWHSNIYLAYLLILSLGVHALICFYRTLKRYRII